jgi:ABC-type Mn2+/Zn2+ transport system ATPase subunit
MNTPLIELHHVSHRYDHHDVLTNIDLAIGADTFTGIVGPSGSGKTTLLRILMGTLQPASGHISRASGTSVAYVPQTETVNWHFPITVFDTVLMSLAPNRRRPWPSRSERERVMTTLDRLGLQGLSGRHIRELSGGQQQRVFLARALVSSPALCVLDEPTSGLDVATRHDILHLLTDLHADGQAIVLTTHDLNGVATHLPNLICLNTSIIAVGPPREVLTPEVLETTFGAPMDVLEHGGMPLVVDGVNPSVRATTIDPSAGSCQSEGANS